jgi:hypothetical protein
MCRQLRGTVGARPHGALVARPRVLGVRMAETAIRWPKGYATKRIRYPDTRRSYRRPPREVRVEGDVAYVQLTRGQTAMVDASDAWWVGECDWNLGSHGYACRRLVRGGKLGSLLLHRAILGLIDPTLEVDHINGNRLDNRRENLRTCTSGQNKVNRHNARVGKSGFIGVRENQCGNWYASACVGREVRHLGTFKTAKEAALVRDAFVRQHHGEFAVLNFPEA